MINTLWNRITVALAFVARLFSATASAQVRDVAIDDFYSCWDEEGVAKTKTGNVRIRVLEVVVRLHPTGFQLCRSHTRPVVEGPDRQSFAMTLFAPTKPNGSWKVNFLAGGSTRECRGREKFKERPPRVCNSATNNNGDTELKIDDRTLSRGAMDLEFTAVRDGEARRKAKNRLVKAAD